MTGRWREFTMPGGLAVDWAAVAYSPELNLYVALSDGSDPDYNATDVYATSVDGEHWTQRQLPVAGGWTALIWTGSFFCGVTFNGAISLVSYDGLTWTVGNTGCYQVSYVNWNGSRLLVYNGGGVGGTLSFAYSDDGGVTWTAGSQFLVTGFDFKYGGVWNGSVFCVLCSAGTANNKGATSPDGITWTVRDLPTSALWRGLAWNGTTYLAVAEFSSDAATSPDGITWTARALPNLGAPTRWHRVIWTGQFFYVITYSDDTVALTYDGITWYTSALPPINAFWYAACAGRGQNMLIFSGALDIIQGVVQSEFWAGNNNCLETP